MSLTHARLADAYKAERPRLLAFIRRSLDAEEAEDALQDVFTRAVEYANVMEPIDRIIAWLYTAARNAIVDLYRKKRRRGVHLPVGSDDGEIEPVAPPADHVKQLDKATLADCLIAAVDDLPPHLKWVYVRQTVEGRSFRDLAEESGVSINTLLARKRYARERLRRRLGEWANYLEGDSP